MKLNKPHIYFWVASVLTYIAGLLNKNSENTIDINVHDTYYILAFYHLATLISITFIIIGIIYFFHYKFKIILNRLLTYIHTIITIIGFGLLLLPTNFFNKNEDNFSLFDSSSYYSTAAVVIFILSIQTILLYNSLSSAYRCFFNNKQTI